MDQLEEKHFESSRGFHYRYYISPDSQADLSKPLIVLCHGWPDSARLWQYMIPHLLPSRHRLLVPDLLGYGGTSKPTDPAAFEIKAMTDDVLELIDSEGITSPIIPLGHDWGSYFATRLHLLNPTRMAALITLNVALQLPITEPFDLDATNASTEQTLGYPIFAYWELFTDPAGPTLLDQHVASVWHALHGDAPDWMRNLFCVRGAFRTFISADRTDVALKPYARDDALKTAWIARMQQDGFTSPCCWYRALKEDHQLATEKGLEGPVESPYLFIGSDGDAVCRTDAVEKAKGAGFVSDLEVREVHSGHWAPFEQPEQISQMVLEWLAKKGLSG